MMGKLWMTFHDNSEEASKAVAVMLLDKIFVLGSRLEDILGVQCVIHNGIPSVDAGKKLSRDIMLFSCSIETTSETHRRVGSRTEAEVWMDVVATRSSMDCKESIPRSNFHGTVTGT